MQAPTDREDSEKQERQRRLLLAYAKVFGVEGKRTEAQEIVWKHLEYMCYVNDTTMVPTREGIVQSIKMECAEGMRIVMLTIKDFLRRATEPEKPKPTVKK